MRETRKIPVKTKWGIFRLEVTERGLYAVRFPEKCLSQKPGACRVGKRFEKLDLTGYTDFEKKVYAALRKVPAGSVVTYAGLAKRAGYPGAARAVGTAMKKNRLPIVIPCHRVVPAVGGLGRYSAGVRWKRLLLALEKKRAMSLEP